jgi:hypothetical protein
VSIGSHIVTITQSASSCTYSITAEPAVFSPVGGTGTLTIATAPDCPWAVSGGDAWLSFGASSTSGSGFGEQTFAVATNPDSETRSTTLSVAGQSVTIVQSVAFGTSDTDADSLPDMWELQFGLDPLSTALDDGPAGDPDHDGVSNLQEYRDGTHPRGFLSRLLAEGASSPFFQTVLALANPDPAEPARVLLRFLKSSGASVAQFVVVPPMSRRTVAAEAVPGLVETAFSTEIQSDVPVLVDRTMSWDATGYGAHSESSIFAPRVAWYFAEGATHSGLELFYLLENPSPTETSVVQVTYLRPSPLAPLLKQYALPPASRTNIWANLEEFPETSSGDFALANTDVSAVIDVLSGPPIAAERSMYLNRPGQVFAAGHVSAGIAAPSTDWFLAEGATGVLFDEFVLVANPNAAPAHVVATYLLPDGRTYEQAYLVDPNSRFNIWLDAEEIPRGSGNFPLADTAVSTILRSTNGVPLIVERAMWWPGSAATWTEAHTAAGVTTTGIKWATAEGEIGGPRHAMTYVLVANPSAQAARVKVTLLFENGTAERTYTVPPNSRFNIDTGFEFASFFTAAGQVPIRFGAVVESLGEGGAAPTPIVVERAMYWDAQGVFWAAGANAVATKLQ